MDERVLVTGGAGFIGSALVRHLIRETNATVLVVDCLTYAGHLTSLDPVSQSSQLHVETVDIRNGPAIKKIVDTFGPQAVCHLAAESHVDRSVDGPSDFVETNVVGTFLLLEATRAHWLDLTEEERARFRFVHVSTDEVYGSLDEERLFTEDSAYSPNSPYAASKAASDHFARSWKETYGLPVIVTNCSNNYGPYQYPEKLIPNSILSALEGSDIPVYGDGTNVRDWLYVDDHVRALCRVLEDGEPGETYLIGARDERRNIEVVRQICDLLDRKKPREDGASYREQITFVQDRPGHDQRYAIDPSKIEADIGWTPRESFEGGLEKTVDWYLDNRWWWKPIRSEEYGGERLGTLP